MSYVTKNYTTDGGNKTVIGGELVIEEGARVTGLPSGASGVADNQSASAATQVAGLKNDFNALLVKLKEAGIMEPDAWALTARIAPSASGKAGENNAKAQASIDGNVITIVASLDALEAFDSASPGQGIHKWIGLGVGTGLSSILQMTYNGGAAAQADVDEAAAVGLGDGEFVLWIKADEVVSTPKVFTLKADGYPAVDVTVAIMEPPVDDDL